MLQQLPAANGAVTVAGNEATVSFTAPLVAGGNLEFGYLGAGFQNRFSATYK